MARIRTVKPEFFRHELLQELEKQHPDLHPMLVFCAIWGHCDNRGVFPWAPKQLALDILPFLWRGSIGEKLGASLVLLWEAGLVSRFEADGKPWGYVPTFLEHQRLSGKEATCTSKYPEPKDVQVGEAPGKHLGSVGEGSVKHPGAQEVELGSGSGSGTPYSPPVVEALEEPSQNGFDLFWSTYPLKVGKEAARKAWAKAKINGRVSEVLAAVEAWKGSPRWQAGTIPNPATWINQRRWEDDPSTATALTQGRSGY